MNKLTHPDTQPKRVKKAKVLKPKKEAVKLTHEENMEILSSEARMHAIKAERKAMAQYLRTGFKKTNFVRNTLGIIFENCGFPGIKAKVEADKEFTANCAILQQKYANSAFMKLISIEFVVGIHFAQMLFETYDHEKFMNPDYNKLLNIKKWHESFSNKKGDAHQ